MDLAAAGLALGESVEILARLAVMAEGGVEERPVGLRLQFRQQCRNRCADIAQYAEIEPTPIAETGCPEVNLSDIIKYWREEACNDG